MQQYLYSGTDTAVISSRPISLPKRVLGSDGLHYAGLADRTPENLTALGFDPAPEKPTYDPATERVVWDVAEQEWTVEDLPPPPPPVPRPITHLEFIGLCQTAGGMSDAQLLAARSDSALEVMWLKFQMAKQLDHDNADTQAGIAALDSLGYLPNGAAAVLAAWPTE